MWESISIPWQLCLEQTWQAYCADTIPVGAVIVDSDSNVVAIGRNHVYEQGASDPLAGSVIAHAEIDALQQLRSADANRTSYYLYSSVEPCPLCCGAIYQSGLKGLYFAAPDSYAGNTNVFGKTPALSRRNVEVYGPYPSIGAVVLTMSIDRCLGLSLKVPLDWRMSYWLNDSPQAVALAQLTHKSGILKTAVREKWPTSEVINYLASQLSSTIR